MKTLLSLSLAAITIISLANDSQAQPASAQQQLKQEQRRQLQLERQQKEEQQERELQLHNEKLHLAASLIKEAGRHEKKSDMVVELRQADRILHQTELSAGSDYPMVLLLLAAGYELAGLRSKSQSLYSEFAELAASTTGAIKDLPAQLLEASVWAPLATQNSRFGLALALEAERRMAKEKRLTSNNNATARLYQILGGFYADEKRDSKMAEAYLRKSSAIYDSVDKTGSNARQVKSMLAQMARERNDYATAEQQYAELVEIHSGDKPQTLSLTTEIKHLASVQAEAGSPERAEQTYLTWREKLKPQLGLYVQLLADYSQFCRTYDKAQQANELAAESSSLSQLKMASSRLINAVQAYAHDLKRAGFAEASQSVTECEMKLRGIHELSESRPATIETAFGTSVPYPDLGTAVSEPSHRKFIEATIKQSENVRIALNNYTGLLDKSGTQEQKNRVNRISAALTAVANQVSPEATPSTN